MARRRLPGVVTILLAALLVSACGPGERSSSPAPRDWAASRSLETGAPSRDAPVVKPDTDEARRRAQTGPWVAYVLYVIAAVVSIAVVLVPLARRRRGRRDALAGEDDRAA